MEKLSSKMLILVFLGVSLINNYILSALGSLHVPTGQSLTFRGMVCVLCSLLGGLLLKERVVPEKFKTQIARFFFAGFGLWATIESYQFARASEIALISRLDLPVIIILGFLVSLTTTTVQKIMSLGLVGAITFSIWIFADEQTTVHGLLLAALGTLTLSLSYLLLNRTARTESAAIVSLTPAVACMIFGPIIFLGSKQSLNLEPLAIFLTAASGVAMYASYRTVRHLYRRYSFLRAQIAYILIPVISIPIDLIGFKHHFRVAEYGTFLIISVGVIVTCLMNEKFWFKSGESKNEYHKATA
ncbi:MAG: hypothetical protein JST80_11485 [Bdellovibrionales bacterium]|nr:hypothetical protein [Bdellovibrionales bacterium]